MRVALFVETYLPEINGVVTHVKVLKDGLEKLGHEVLVVCADVNAKHHYIKDGILHCPAMLSKRIYNYGLALPISTKRKRLIKEFNPDIIHIHTEFGVGFSGAMIARHLNVPLVYTLHTMYDEYIYYIAPRPFIPLMTKVSHSYFKFLAKRANALTGPSKKVDEYCKSCGVDKNVSVIPNPVELDMFEPSNINPVKKHEFRKKYNISDDTMLACFCGRLGHEKSVDVLIKFWAQTVTPQDNVKLMIIGEGPAKEGLEELADKLGVKDTVIFTGRVEHVDLPPYYAGCDCYITTSLSDTNSISMLEAMATGLPVLHLHDELNKGQIIPGVNGMIFSNAEQMHECIIKLKNLSDDEREALSRSTRESVKQSGAENLANYLLTIYNQNFHEKSTKKRKRLRTRIKEKQEK